MKKVFLTTIWEKPNRWRKRTIAVQANSKAEVDLILLKMTIEQVLPTEVAIVDLVEEKEEALPEAFKMDFEREIKEIS